jgi:hypothetical protein
MMKMGGSVTSIFKCLVFLQCVMLYFVGPTSGNGAGQPFNGRPETQSVEDIEDRLLAAYAKTKLKEKRLTKAEFLLQPCCHCIQSMRRCSCGAQA